MKRIVSCLLAAVLILTPALPAHAVEADPAMSDSGTVPENSAQVTVTIIQALALYRGVDYTVSLSGQEDQVITLPGEDMDKPDMQNGGVQNSVTFENLAEGSYILQVSAPGFAVYTQEITVGKLAYTVQLTNGFMNGFAYGSDDSHPGVILIGDADGNGVVDGADQNLIIDGIENGTKGAADLNGDGVTDLADLEYFTKGFQITENTAATIETSIPASAVDAEAGPGTLLEGSLDELLKQEGSVILKREDGNEISETHLVTLNFSFADGEQFPIGGIEIDAGGDNPIKDADIGIVYLDENGAEQTMDIPVRTETDFLLRASGVTVSKDQGILNINLGGQVAVKKVTITIKGMKNDHTLATISKVEFVNDMEHRIPAPQMDIPQNLTVTAENKAFIRI